MLSKEEYVEKIVRDILNGEMKLENFVEEHFELVEEYNTLLTPCNALSQPYKFEDLKKGMWVWDNQLKWCFEIAICKVEIKGYENLKMFKVKNYDDSLTLMIFEKNRFYPVQMANVRCE